MFLIERIIGVSTYVMIMFVMCFLIYKTTNKKQIKTILKIYWFLLAVLAFFYIPTESADLSRYISAAKLYSSFSVEEIVKILGNSKVPMQIIYFYLLGLTKINGLIPAVTSMLFYGFSFSILYDAIKRFELNNKSASISLLFFMEMGGFLCVISGIRSFVAFSAIAYCCYYELIGNKSFVKHIPLYLFASLMHPAAMVLTIIRLLTILINKEKSNLKKIGNFFLVGILIVLIFKYGSQYIDAILDKTDTYVSGDGYSYIWEYLISWIYMIFSTLFILIIKTDTSKENEISIFNYKNFILLINFIIFIFSFEYSIFTRFQLFSSILFLPYFSICLSSTKKESKFFTFAFIFVSVAIFAIACTRGNLCGFKFLLFN